MRWTWLALFLVLGLVSPVVAAQSSDEPTTPVTPASEPDPTEIDSDTPEATEVASSDEADPDGSVPRASVSETEEAEPGSAGDEDRTDEPTETEKSESSEPPVSEIEALEAEVDRVEPGSPEAEQLFDGVQKRLEEELRNLVAELDELDRARAAAESAFARTTKRSRLGRAETDAAREALIEERVRLRAVQAAQWDRTLEVGQLAGALVDLRNDLFGLLPDERRRKILTLRSEGRRALDFEWNTLTIWERAVAAKRRQAVTGSGSAWDTIRRAFTSLRLLIRVGLAVLLWLVLRRRLVAYGRGFDETDAKPTQRLTSAVTPGLLILTGAFGLDWGLEHLDQFPIAYQVLLFVYFYGGYRLLADTSTLILLRLAAWNRTLLSPQQQRRLTGQIRWVARLITVVLAVSALVDLRLGHGVLFHYTRTIGWWLVVLLVLGFVLTWRVQLADTYLRTHPKGLFATRVRRRRGSILQAFYAPLMAGALVWQGVTAMLRDAAMRSEGSKRLVAYFLLKRIEQQAREHGYASGDLEALPPDVVTAFEPRVSVDDLECVGDETRLDEAREMLEAWIAGRGGSSVVLTGEDGAGRDAWLEQFTENVRTVRLRLGERVLDRTSLIERLRAGFIEVETGDQTLESAIDDPTPKIFVITDAERLFLSDVNGFHAVLAILELILSTSDTVFWVLSMDAFAFQHLRASLRQVGAMRHIEMAGWTDLQIQRLVSRRCARTGVPVSFEELAVTLDPTAAIDNDRSSIAYARLLWDYSDGNPTVALYYFVRSLVPTESGLTVRFFQRPPIGRVAEAGDDALFVLAGIVRHRALTASEAARVTGIKYTICRNLLSLLSRLGCLTTEGEAYSVALAWRADVIRLLRRQNMLPS